MSNTIVIIGAGSGIGLALSQQLLALPNLDNIQIVGCSRQLEKLAPMAAAHPATFKPMQCDVTNEESVQALFAAVKESGRTISGVVNCAGTVLLKPAHLTSLAEFSSTIAVNLTSCFLLLKYAIPLASPNGANFVFFSTAAVAAHVANHDAIAAAKSGVEGLTRAAAATYASKNIRINAIAPGLVKTPLTERIHGNPAAAQASTNMHALGRLGEPADVASLAAWLLSPAATWMTGQVIGFDGGLSLKSKQ